MSGRESQPVAQQLMTSEPCPTPSRKPPQHCGVGEGGQVGRSLPSCPKWGGDQEGDTDGNGVGWGPELTVDPSRVWIPHSWFGGIRYRNSQHGWSCPPKCLRIVETFWITMIIGDSTDPSRGCGWGASHHTLRMWHSPAQTRVLSSPAGLPVASRHSWSQNLTPLGSWFGLLRNRP